MELRELSNEQLKLIKPHYHHNK